MSDLADRVANALDESRPYLQEDGGDIILLGIVDDCIVEVQLQGACIDCHVNQMTLKHGVEATVKKYAPEVREIRHVDNA